jgi:hypothetical protein
MIGSRVEMITRFERRSPSLEAGVEHGVSYGYVRERGPNHYPSVEEFFVVAPAVVGAPDGTLKAGIMTRTD